jgi:amino acid transporter
MTIPARLFIWLFGPALRTDENRRQALDVRTGIAALGLDALASAAYGPEAALTVLMPLGAAGPRHMLPIAATIVALLIIVQLSYQQTIGAYPEGGGSYVVVSRNLGARAGRLAGAALWVDYVLNVAVAISAGVGALVSAFPPLLPHTLALCLAILGGLTLINLRGVRDTGTALILPTYAFVASLGLVLLLGVAQALRGSGAPAPLPAEASVPGPLVAASPWLLLRAFAGGCTAMTGVEAVSNATPMFAEPRVRRARQTLAAIVSILAFLVIAVAVLCRVHGIRATPGGDPRYQSVLSQVTGAVVGRGPFYYVTMAAITAVLCLSANTSFAAFPRLCQQLAVDKYLPARFAHQGPRLVYTAGVVSLATMAAALLIAWRGVTDRLVPLFAVGAFLAFTLSQLGMVAHWRGARPHRARLPALVLNAVGAVATAATLAIVVAAKFTAGAWLAVLAIGGLLLLFARHRAQICAREDVTAEALPLDMSGLTAPIVIVPLRRLNLAGRAALRFAMTLSADVTALQLIGADIDEHDLTADWTRLIDEPCRAAGRPSPRLLILRSNFRRVVAPIVDHARRLREIHPERVILVVLAEPTGRHWYHVLLRNHTASAVKTRLRFTAESGIAVVRVSI